MRIRPGRGRYAPSSDSALRPSHKIRSRSPKRSVPTSEYSRNGRIPGRERDITNITNVTGDTNRIDGINSTDITDSIEVPDVEYGLVVPSGNDVRETSSQQLASETSESGESVARGQYTTQRGGWENG